MEFGHYTSLEGLLGIIGDEKLWATNVRYLNDRREFQHALDLIEEAFETFDGSDDYQKLPEFRKRVLYEVEQQIRGLASIFYTVSFSGKPDLLSQWRGYCPANAGYCIVFELDELHQHIEKTRQRYVASIKVKHCLYNDSAKKKRIAEILSVGWEAYKTNREAMDDTVHELFSLAAYFKHVGFEEEDEARLVALSVQGSTKYRAGKASLIPYLELDIDRNAIKRIYIGPTVEKELAENALRGFLRSIYGRRSIPIEITHAIAPFRS